MDCLKIYSGDVILLELNSREFDIIRDALIDYIFGKLEFIAENGDIEHLFDVIKAID